MNNDIGFITEYRVLQSAAGYYIGSLYYDTEFNALLPYDRNSFGYYNNAATAHDALLDFIYSDCEDKAESLAVFQYFDMMEDNVGLHEIIETILETHDKVANGKVGVQS